MPKQGYTITETEQNQQTTKAYEGGLTQGAGCLHIRASYEEGLENAPQNEEFMRMPANVTVEKARCSRSKFGTYLAGITGQHPLLKEEAVNLPNPLSFRLGFDGEWYDADSSTTRNFSRRLNLCNGELCREFEWHISGGAVLRCSYRRVVARGQENCIVQHMRYSLVKGGGRLELLSDIDENVKTNGYNHFAWVTKKAEGPDIQLELETDTGALVRMVSGHTAEGVIFWDTQDGGCAAAADLRCGDEVEVTKITLISGSNGGPLKDFAALSQELAALKAAGAETAFQQSASLWEELWQSCEVEIQGDDEAQLAVNFSLYHLLRCAHENSRVAICAKGFSGEAYFGHFFWDTEMYMLPFYLSTLPKTARALAEFRINTLPGAVENAASYGYSGAKYPWESSVAGTEQCPNWQYADHEVHVTADVVYGLWACWQATKDFGFLCSAAPVLVETARFWAERVYSSGGSYNINGVMGPDEYVCFCNNNAYTNYMVKYSLSRTLEALEIIKSGDESAFNGLNLEPDFISRIKHIADNISLNWDKSAGVIPQCDGFENLEEPDFAKIWPDRSRPFGSFVSQERNYRTKALKQADVLMLPFLFPGEFSDESIAANLEYYLPYTTHDSSLSAIIHSILFCRLGRLEDAYAYFEKALGIDLDFEAGGAAEGVHIANCGGIWQAVVQGFGGLGKAGSGEMEISPSLPAHWQGLSFRIIRNNIRYCVKINKDAFGLMQVDIQQI